MPARKQIKPSSHNLTKKEPTTENMSNPSQARGVGLRASEWREIDQFARSLGYKPHALAVALLRYGLQALRDGKIKTKTQTTLDL